MNNFLPDQGTLFYADCKRTYTQAVDAGGVTTILKNKDRSYEQTILRMLAADDRLAVAEIVYSYCYGDAGRRVTLMLRDFEFSPVGPDVMKALELSPTPEKHPQGDAP